MGARRDDLKATAESLLADSDRVRDLEEQSLTEDPTSQRFRDLSAESERVTRGMAVKARAQRQIAGELAEEPPAPRHGE